MRGLPSRFAQTKPVFWSVRRLFGSNSQLFSSNSQLFATPCQLFVSKSDLFGTVCWLFWPNGRLFVTVCWLFDSPESLTHRAEPTTNHPEEPLTRKELSNNQPEDHPSRKESATDQNEVILRKHCPQPNPSVKQNLLPSDQQDDHDEPCHCFGVLGEAVFFAWSSPIGTASPRTPKQCHAQRCFRSQKKPGHPALGGRNSKGRPLNSGTYA